MNEKGYAQNLINESTESLKQEHEQRVSDFKESGILAPVEGISLEEWAHVQAKLVSGVELEYLISKMGIDRTKWDYVSTEWTERMSNDHTHTISTVYGQAFIGSGQGQFASAGQDAAQAMNSGGTIQGAEPVSFEKWIEISVAQEAGSVNGEDPLEVLARFKMTPADWGTVGGYWGQKFSENAMEMLDDHRRLTDWYRIKYGLEPHSFNENGEDIRDEAIKKIMNMAVSKSENILDYLKDKFPDDADDNDALDHYLDTACDRLAENCDKDSCMFLLNIRYQFQDSYDSKEDFIDSEMTMLFD